MQAQHTAQPYIWLQDDEAEGEADCGCRLHAEYQGSNAAMFLCKMHSAAPALYVALTRILHWIDAGCDPSDKAIAMARHAINAAQETH